MKLGTIPVSAIQAHPVCSMRARDYFETDIDAVKRQVRAQYPGKQVRAEICRDGQFRVTVTETFHVRLMDGKVQTTGDQ